MARCRSCKAEIIWVVTEAGRRMPLDKEPAERPTGLFRLEWRDGLERPPTAISVQSEHVYISHFATCPNADQHRKS